MKRLLFILLFFHGWIALPVYAGQWHNLTDGTYCYQVDTSTGDVWCFDASGNISTLSSDVILTTGGTIDINGIADGLVIDADADTSISAPNDDQIDIEVAGADDFTITANTLNVLSGSSILVNTGGLLDVNGIADGLVIDADGDTTISAPTDDQIDIEISGADDFTITANDLSVLSGSKVDVESGATLEVDSGATFTIGGTNTLTSAISGTGNTTDITLNVPTDGGNANVQNQFVGIPKLAGWAVGVSRNGTTNTVTGYIDETPAGEWTATTNITSNTDSTEYRKGTASLELVVGAAPADGNGADNTLSGGDQDWSGDESFGFWMMCTATTTAGDWVLEITDSVAGATEVNVPALGTANKWTWVEVDISGVADASKDVIQTIGIDLSTAGATSMISQTCNFDYAYKWDAADEEALSQDVYEDGVIAAYASATAAASVNDVSVLVEGTAFLIHYEAGNDFFIAITDQSANQVWGFAALE